MFIFQFMGGLGNQMFQYAAARALSLKRNIPFKIDFDDPYVFVRREYSLDVFDLHATFASKSELRKSKPKRRWIKRWWMLLGKDPANKLFKENKDFHFDPDFFNRPDGSYISGFWQTEKYFSEIEDIIRKDFKFTTPLSVENKKWSDLISSCNAVSVHIRRGDYVSVAKTNAIHGVCDLDYYQNAIAHITGTEKDPVFFFFSDDMDWVIKNICIPYSCYYVTNNDDKNAHEDMRLMSCCKHHIIANSSFSWWGAWLNPNTQKKVIAPERWMKTTSGTFDLLPASWIKM